MNKEQKAAVIEQIAGQIEEADAVFAVDYRGISVPQAAELRTRLREADATFRVVKNSLTERAADQAGAESLKALLDGPTALTFVRGDAAVAAKALADAQRATDVLDFKGGLLSGREIGTEDIKAIARLPARDILYGQLVGLTATPLTGLVRGLGALVGGLAAQLGQIRDQGLIDAEAPPAEEPAAAEEPGPEEAPAAEAEPDTSDSTNDDETAGAEGAGD